MTSRLPLVFALAGLVGAGVLTMALTADADQNSDRPEFQRAHFVASPADRAAFLDARIAALHAGLELTADQEKLWPAVETAFRDAHKTMDALREKARNEPRPADPIAWLQRASEKATARGETLKKLADAAAPLYAALTDEQKHRLPILLHAIHPGARFAMMGNGPRGPEGGWRGRDQEREDFGKDRGDEDRGNDEDSH